jgi:hypothetical protein
MISTGVFVALEASPFQAIHNLGKLAKGYLTVFYDLKLVRCPRSLDPTLVTLPSMSLIPFDPFSGDDVPVALVDRFNGVTTRACGDAAG